MASLINKNLLYSVQCLFLLLFQLSNYAQVGIGTTTPGALLHIEGEYVAPSINEVILLEQNFNSTSIGRYSNQQGGGNVPPCPSNGWMISNNPSANTRCSNCSDRMLYINADVWNCQQEATAIVPFAQAPSTLSVTISFDYRIFRGNYNNGDGILRLVLRNEFDNTDQQLLLANSNANTSYSGSINVQPGSTYSLRFHYSGNWDYGATVDNIKVTEEAIGTPGKYAFKLEDGTQGNGYVLTSDANGNATWRPVSLPRPYEDGFSAENPGENSSEEIIRLQQVLTDLKKTIHDRQKILKSENKRIEALEEKLQALRETQLY